MKALVLALATVRLTQLTTEDEITDPIRSRINLAYEETPDDSWQDTVLGFIDTVVNCPDCASVWAGAGILTAERLGPVGRFLVRALALSQAALIVRTLTERINR